MKVKKGNKVKVEYTGMLEDGTVFDSSEKHGKLLEFQIGEGKVLKGFEEALIGMKIGEEKEIELKPEEAYGNKNPQLIKKIPKEQIPQDKELKPGMIMIIGTPDGRQFPAMITDVTDKEVTINLNHPLAGKTLKFKIKVVESKP